MRNLGTSRVASLVVAAALAASSVPAQSEIDSAWPSPLEASEIPPNLTKLRPIQCIAYDPKPWDFGGDAYFDSDFFNSDFTALWGDDGQAGARNDLETFARARLNMLHIYNWNAQRKNHTAFLDAARERRIKVMVPISNFTAQTITGTTNCPSCPKGYKAAFNLVKDIFNQVYRNNRKTPDSTVAMWSIYNEYELNKYDPVNVAFVVQAILTLEDQAGIAPENRLPITAPVSDATMDAAARRTLPNPLRLALERAQANWLAANPGRNASDVPGGVLAMLAISNALSDGQKRSSYQSQYEPGGPQTVSVVPADFWKKRWIASSNPFRIGSALADYLTNPAQFQSAWPGTTAFNTLPPLFFAEMGYSQRDAGNDLQRQASVVLGQLEATAPLARNASTPQGYFLGSCFFQHTYVDTSEFQAFDSNAGEYSFRTEPSSAPWPASGQRWRVDVLKPLPVWNSVLKGYATIDTADDDDDDPDQALDRATPALLEPRP